MTIIMYWFRVSQKEKAFFPKGFARDINFVNEYIPEIMNKN